jgi:hypothetical protein
MMTNTNLLESLKNKKSPLSLENEFQTKFKIQNSYKLKKGLKGEKIDSLIENDFEKTRYEYLNYLCETPFIDKMNKFEELNKNKESDTKLNLLNELKEEEKDIEEACAQKNYLNYLKKIKKKDKFDSYGASLLENKTYEDDLEDEFGLDEKEPNEEKGTETESLIGDNARSDSIHITQATYMKNGSLESYPYEGMDDYDYHILLEDESAQPESNFV